MKNITIRTLSVLMSLVIIMLSLPISTFGASTSDAEEIHTNESEVQKEAFVMFEDTDKREPSIKYFKMSDGSYTAVEYGKAVHYENDGIMQDIKNNICVDPDDPNTFTVGDNPAKISFPSVYSGDPVVYEYGNYSVSFALMAQEYDVSLLNSDTNSSSVYPSISISQHENDSYCKAEELLSLINAECIDEINRIEGSCDIAGISSSYFEEFVSDLEDMDVSTNISDYNEIVREYNNTVMYSYPSESVASYKDVMPGIDIEYVVNSDSLKENIVLNENNVKGSISFEVDFGELTPVLNFDGSIVLSDKNGGCIFTIAAPYMYDANNIFNNEIEVDIVALEGGKYKYTLSLDEEWLSDNSREYPVTIDPTITLNDTSIYTGIGYFTDSSIIENDNGSFVSVGPKLCLNQRCESQAMIKFGIPSEINNSSRITKATVSFAGFYNSSSTCKDGISIGAYPINKYWHGSSYAVGTSGNADYNTLLDYINVNDAVMDDYAGKWYTFDITLAASQWLERRISNYGIALRKISGNGTAYFFGDNSSVTNSIPVVTYHYRDAEGIEDYWTYTSVTAGRSGSIAVNNFNGNVITVMNGASTSGNHMPISVAYIYSRSADKYKRFWRTNYNMIISECNSDNSFSSAYCLTDGDGTDHYFYEYQSGKYKDEDGLGLTLTKIVGETDYKYLIKDKSGTSIKFDHFGRLKYMVDTNGNYNLITYESMTDPYDIRIKSISDGNDNAKSASGDNPTVQTVNISYNENSDVVSMTSPNGEEVVFVFDDDCLDGKLLKVIYNDSTTESGTTEITYRTSSYVSCVTDGFGHKTTVEYAPTGWLRASSIAYGTESETLEKYTFSYSFGETTITDTENRSVKYQFDSYGHTVGVVNIETSVGQNYEYGAPGGNSGKENKLLTASKSISPSLRLLSGGAFNSSNDLSGYAVYPSGYSDSFTKTFDSDRGNTFKGSMKVEKGEECAGTKYLYRYYDISGNPGTYSLSSYVNTAGAQLGGSGVRVVINLFDEYGYRTGSSSSYLVYTDVDEWVRLQTSIEALPGDQYLHIGVYFDADTYGTVWIDDFQFEKASGAGSFNLLENSSFLSDKLGWLADSFTVANKDADAPSAFEKQINAEANISSENKASQEINISGNKDDVFVFGAWAKGTSLNSDISTEYKSGTPKFSVSMRFYNGDVAIGNKDIVLNFNPYMSSWQYVFRAATAPGAYTKIKYTLDYSYNGNSASFAAPFLFKENYGSTYTYDENGNLISSENLSGKKSNFLFKNDYLMSSISPTGSSFAYYRDNVTNNIQYAYSTSGQRTEIAYDSTGNAVSMKIIGFGNVSDIQQNKNYYIVNAQTAKAITVRHNSSKIDDGSWTADYFVISPTLEWVTEDQYRIKSGDQYLTVDGWGMDISLQSLDENSARQIFKVVRGDDGSFYIAVGSRNASGTTFTEFVGESQLNGEIVAQPAGGMTTYNKWYLVEYSSVSDYMASSVTYTEDGNNTASATDSRGNTSTYTYDEYGRLSSATDPSGVSSAYTYDIMGRTTSVASSGSSVTYNYAQDQIASIVRGNDDVMYNFTYDAFGRNTSISVGSGESSRNLSQMMYSSTGLLSRQTYGNGSYIDLTYDALDRLVSKLYNGVETVRYSYDNKGNIYHVDDLRSVRSTDFTSDLIGRTVKSITTENGSLLTDTSWSYLDGEDIVGRSTVNLYSDGSLHSTQQTEYITGKAIEGEIPGAVYGVKLNGENLLSYTYDNLGRLTSASLDAAGTTENYTYWDVNDSGKTTSLVRTVSDENDTYEYTYDSRGNISAVTKNGAAWESYVYDSLNRLVRHNSVPANKTEIYAYDAGGNILSKTEYSYTTDTPSDETANSVFYTYGDSTWGDLLTNFNGQNITYDAIGNPLMYRDGMSMTWSEGRTLSSIMLDDGEVINYVYDADGRRVKQESDSTDYTFIYDGYGRLAAVKFGNFIASTYIYDESGSAIGMRSGNYLFWFKKNLQGDIIKMYMDGYEDTRYVNYTYDAWGNVTEEVSRTMMSLYSRRNFLRYRGYVYDKLTGLYYLGSRYYDPQTGRFINADGYVSTGTGLDGYNMFAYCNNNPIRRADYSGALWEDNLDQYFSVTAVRTINYTDLYEYYIEKYKDSEQFVLYDVPLYYQGDTSLCWAYCQKMMDCYNKGVVLNQNTIDIIVKIHAIFKNGPFNWNRGNWPDNLGEKIEISSIQDLYDALYLYGPLYATYNMDGGAGHMVIITGVDVTHSRVFTNNPWGIMGNQSYGQFLQNIPGENKWTSKLSSVYTVK